VQKPVDKQGARHLVEFVFHWHAALQDFDYRVDFIGWIAAGGNLADVHDKSPPIHFPIERVRPANWLFHSRAITVLFPRELPDDLQIQ